MQIVLIAVLIIIAIVLVSNYIDSKKDKESDKRDAARLERIKEWDTDRGNELKKLRKRYDEALEGTDKKAALDAGREYYKTLNFGKLTPKDEIAIGNDVATMK